MSATWLSLALLGLLGAPVETQATAETLLYVRTSPPGAKLLLDGKPLGTSDDLFAVEPGVRRIVIELEGYDPQTKEVTIDPGKVTRVVIELKKRPGNPADESDWSTVRNGVQCRIRPERPVWEYWEKPRFSLVVRNVGSGEPVLDTVNLYFDDVLCPMVHVQPPMEIPPGKQIVVPLDLDKRLGGSLSSTPRRHKVYARLIGNEIHLHDSPPAAVEFLPPRATSVEEVERALSASEIDGVKVKAGFLPDKREIVLGEPGFVTFLVKNVSPKVARNPFPDALSGGSYDRTGYLPFSITATDEKGQPVPQVEPPMTIMNQLLRTRHQEEFEIPPGDTRSFRLDLDRCLRLDKPGVYAVTCRCDNLDGHGKVVEARFVLTIHPATDEFVRPLLQELQQRMKRDKGKPTEDVLAALCNVNNQQMMPDLFCLLKSADRDTSRTALGGLAKFGRTIRLDLDLEKTPLADEDLACLKDLPKLYDLRLPEGISDAGLAHLRGLTGLAYLDANRTKVTNEGLKHVGQLTKLELLSLNHTKVTDAGLAHLKGLANLHYFYLDGTEVTGAGLAHLKGLKHVEDLRANGTPFDDAGLANLRGLPGLEHLELRGTKITDRGLANLKELPRLRSVVLDNTAISDGGIDDLAALKDLSELVVMNTKISAKGTEKLKQALPKTNFR